MTGWRSVAAAVVERFALGAPSAVEMMTEVRGGGVHRLWRLRTDAGTFAVKGLRLDAHDQEALDLYRLAWPLEEAAARSEPSIPMAIPVLSTAQNLLEIVPDERGGERVVRVHSWVEGMNPPWTAAPLDLADAVGRTLARIHLVGATLATAPQPATDVGLLAARPSDHWATLVQRAEGHEWSGELRRATSALCEAEKSVEVAAADPGPLVFAHRDVNPKNVLVATDGSPVVLDWDSAGDYFARQELASAALIWAGVETGEPSPESIRALIRGYRTGGGIVDRLRPEDATGWILAWLRFTEFNVDRLLGERGSIDQTERDIATERLRLGLAQVRRFNESAPHWTKALSA